MKSVGVLAVTVAVVGIAACGGPTQQNLKQEQTPVTPLGTIVARIIDGSTYGPLEGVSAQVVGISGPTLVSDANGVVVFTNAVVNSDYTLFFQKAGYLPRWEGVYLRGSDGSYPVAGNSTSVWVSLYRNDGEVRGNVFLPNGRPAANATVVADTLWRGNGVASAVATTDATGAFRLTGLAAARAGLNHSIYALWYDENGDQLADYATTTAAVDVFPGVISRVFLTYDTLGQRVIATNVVDGAVAPSQPLEFTLALPVINSNQDSGAYRSVVVLNRSRGDVDVAVQTNWTSAVHLTVRPVIPLREGDRFQIQLRVTTAGAASSGAPTFSANYDFRVRSPNAPPVTDQVQSFTVTNPTVTATRGPRNFDYDSNAFRLTWDSVAAATSYVIFAKDTLHNPNYVRVLEVSTQALPRYSVNFAFTGALAMAFDPNDGTRPLALGNKVTFAVVPVDAFGNTPPLNAAPTAQVADNVAPRSIDYALVSPAPGEVDPVFRTTP